MRRLGDFKHGGVRGPLEERGAAKITQIIAQKVEILIFILLGLYM